jgi:galactose-1-phosphate uridylyltransferase
LEIPVCNSGSSSILARFCKEFIVSDTQKKNSSSLLASSFESIADYRQRTGKSEEEFTVDDYVFLIGNALKAAGFFVSHIHTTCVHFPEGPAGEMAEERSRPSNEYSFGLFAIPGSQRKA